MLLKDTNEIFANDLCDPTYAAGYVNISLEEDGIEGLLYSLQKVAKARGMTSVAEASGLNREALYRTLSPAGNPTIKSLAQLTTGLGMRLVIAPSNIDHVEVPFARALDDANEKDHGKSFAEVNKPNDLVVLISELNNQVQSLHLLQDELRSTQAECQRTTSIALDIINKLAGISRASEVSGLIANGAKTQYSFVTKEDSTTSRLEQQRLLESQAIVA